MALNLLCGCFCRDNRLLQTAYEWAAGRVPKKGDGGSLPSAVAEQLVKTWLVTRELLPLPAGPRDPEGFDWQIQS